MLESIKKLRKKLEEDTAGDFVFTTCPEQHGFRAGATIENYEAIADEIEREVAERYMELPLDADGVPIRVGDVMEFLAFEIEKPVTRMVDGIGQGVFFAWCGERVYQQHEAKRYRHYHAPTVEDVLYESLKHFGAVEERTPEVEEWLHEQAAKLQLREVDE